jgi:four helix bundle protein
MNHEPRTNEGANKRLCATRNQTSAVNAETIKGCAIANQIVRSGMSVAANYRASCRSRSRAEFVAKIGTVLEEADETLLWLELIGKAKILPRKRIEPLRIEADELVAIMAATRKTAASNLNSAI